MPLWPSQHGDPEQEPNWEAEAAELRAGSSPGDDYIQEQYNHDRDGFYKNYVPPEVEDRAGQERRERLEARFGGKQVRIRVNVILKGRVVGLRDEDAANMLIFELDESTKAEVRDDDGVVIGELHLDVRQAYHLEVSEYEIMEGGRDV